MNPSEDPNDRLIDSLLREQARGKPDEVLLGAIAAKLQAVPKAKSPRRNLDFFWPAMAAAVVLLAAGGLLWNAFEKPDEKTGRWVEAPGPDPEKAPEKAGDALPVAAPGEEEIAVQDEKIPPVNEPEIAGTGDPKPVLDQGSGGTMDEQDMALNALRYVRDESTMWYVQFGLEAGGQWAPKFTGLQADGTKLSNRVPATHMIGPGDVFFGDGPMAGRFKYLGIVSRDVTSPRTGLTHHVKFAQYEDLKPNKKGERYESQYGLPDAQLEARAYHDRTAVMEFQGEEFKVEERTRFSLPPGGEGQEFFLKQVARDRIVVEFMGADGKAVFREIGKK
jgi:hypothetical protein